jgi:hypothetical protein
LAIGDELWAAIGRFLQIAVCSRPFHARQGRLWLSERAIRDPNAAKWVSQHKVQDADLHFYLSQTPTEQTVDLVTISFTDHDPALLLLTVDAK